MTERIAKLLVLLLLLPLLAGAQELTVKSMEVAPMDLSASTQPRNDLNGNPCALVKVQLPAPGAKFEGNVIGNAEYDTGEYWVYMSEGSYMLQVKHPNFYPLMINFRDYDIRKVESKVTYVLTLSMPQMTGVTIDDGNRYLVLSVTPTNSVVEVDGKLVPLDNDGTARVLLSQGSHSYRVRASGCADEEGTVVIGTEKVTREIHLQSVLAQVRVSCPTPGAQIYVNDQMKGTSPWSGTLTAGNYQFEARLKGHHSAKLSEMLAERANRQINLPALVAITGNLDVNYKPTDAEVWLDGKRLGTSPDIFRNIIIGTHEVELRKEGYGSVKQQVTITENNTASINGSLQANPSTSSTSVSPAVAITANKPVNTVENKVVTTSGTNMETFTVNDVSFNMVQVEGGTFLMGATKERDGIVSKDEKPTHQVTLSSYFIGETEVTQSMWKAVMGTDFNYQKSKTDNYWQTIDEGPDHPMAYVSWSDCQEFILKLNQMTGRSFRLPTEAEWEFAARGGKKSLGYELSGGNRDYDVAVCGYNGAATRPVKTKKANELGLFDMSGNVLEWCQDWYGKYSGKSQTNPTGPEKGTSRVTRGGHFCSYDFQCRSADRSYWEPTAQKRYIGFRLALTEK